MNETWPNGVSSSIILTELPETENISAIAFWQSEAAVGGGCETTAWAEPLWLATDLFEGTTNPVFREAGGNQVIGDLG